MKKRITLLLLLLACLTGIRAQQTFTGPKSSYQNGEQVLTFDNDKLTARISVKEGAPFLGFDKNPQIYVYVKNKNVENLSIDPKTFKCSYEKKGKIKNVEVYTAKVLYEKVDNNIFWAMSNNKTETSKVESTSKDKHGNKERQQSTVTTSVYTGEADREREYTKAKIDEVYLRRNDLEAGQEVEGMIVTDRVKADTFRFIMVLDGDTYQFDCNFGD